MANSVFDIQTPPGLPGDNGAPGSVWRNGSGVPSNGLGVNGDFYINIDNGDVYYKSSGTYSVSLNITGPQGLQGPSLTTGLQSERLEAGTENALFVPNDVFGQPFSIDNGSSWDPIMDGFKCSPIDVSSLTSISFGSYITLTQNGDGAMFLMTGDANGANKAAAAVVAIPESGAYSLTVGLDILTLHYTTNAAWMGLCITDGAGATPKLDLFYIVGQNNGYAMLGYGQNWTNPTTYSANINTIAMPLFMRSRIFLRLTDDRTTNLSFQMSFDGVNYDALINPILMARATYLTPAYIGVCCGHGAVSIATTLTRMRARIFHFELAQI